MTTQTQERKPLDWVNILFLSVTPVLAAAGTIWYSWNYGITRWEVINFLLFFFLTGLSITGGYHRYYTHRAYECNKFVQFLYLVFGAAAVENSVLHWASDHRAHHRYVDMEEDPYNIVKGGLHAHMGWIFHKDTRPAVEKFSNIPDLLKDPLVCWQDRWYLPLVVVASFLLPTAFGLIHGRPLGGLLWGGLLRVVVVQHMTFFINSWAHMFGTRPYSTANSARDNWMLGPITFGEGYHNFHHAFQADYRNGVRWYAFDNGKWLLQGLSMLGWAWNLKRTPEPLILKARLEVEAQGVTEKLSALKPTQAAWDLVASSLGRGRSRLEKAMIQYHRAKVEYKHRKAQWSADARRQWRAMIDQYQVELKEAGERWTDLIRLLNRIPQPSAKSLLTLTAVVDVLKTRF